MFSIHYENQAARFLEKLAVRDDIKRILNAIEKLTENPFPSDAKRVEGYTDVKVFRIRVGQYRVLYYVDYKASTITLVKIDKRERVY